MRTIATGLVVVLWLLPAAFAEAKGVAALKVCGANDCREVRDREDLAVVAFGGVPGDPPTAPAEWYRVDVAVHGDMRQERYTSVILPSLNRMRGEQGGWMRLSDAELAPFRRLVHGLEPKPAPTLDPRLMSQQRAQVAGVVEPAAEAAASSGSAWSWIGSAVVLVLLALAGAGLAIRRRRRLPPTAPAEG
jgi:hypothetical protein